MGLSSNGGILTSASPNASLRAVASILAVSPVIRAITGIFAVCTITCAIAGVRTVLCPVLWSSAGAESATAAVRYLHSEFEFEVAAAVI